MGKNKEFFTECETAFGKVVRAEREKDSNAIWLLFEYIEWRIKKQKEYENAGTKRDIEKSDESNSTEDQFSFGFPERDGH